MFTYPCSGRNKVLDKSLGLRSSFNLKFIGIWTYDLASDRVFGDRLAGEYFGLTEYAFRNGVDRTVFRQAIDPADLTLVQRTLHEALHQGKPIDVTYHVNSPSLGRRKIRAVGTCYRESHEPIICAGYFIDKSGPHSRLAALEAINDLINEAFDVSVEVKDPFLRLLLDMPRIEAGTLLGKEYSRRFSSPS